jgi:division protein CdvB (Snf7/Vps24/ESCRT-III family)
VIGEDKTEFLPCSKAIFDQLLAVIKSTHFLREMCVNQVATKILAQQLIRLRQQIAKLQGSRAQMRGVATHTQVRGITG